jgi:hypothetical protein
MHTLAQSAYLDSSFGIDEELPRAGSALENPYVFDASARELKAMAAKGLVDIVEERTTRVAGEVLIDRLRFRRVH